MNGDYRFSSPTGESLVVQMNLANEEGSVRFFIEPSPPGVSGRICIAFLFRFPFMTLRVIAGIHGRQFAFVSSSSGGAILARSGFGLSITRSWGTMALLRAPFARQLSFDRSNSFGSDPSNWFARGNARLRDTRSGLHATSRSRMKDLCARGRGTTSVSGNPTWMASGLRLT